MPPAADILCDASVVLKWFHSEGEEEVEASRALLDLHRSHAMALSVLDLTAYEVGNALLRGIGVGADKVSAVLDALDVICPRLALTPAELSHARRLSRYIRSRGVRAPRKIWMRANFSRCASA